MATPLSTISPGLALAYSAEATYKKDALILYKNKYWICTAAIDAPEAWTEDHWSSLSDVLSQLALLKSVLPSGVSDFSEETSYAVGDWVWHENKLYICKEAISGEWTGEENWTDMNNVSKLFSSYNKALNTAIDTEIAARCSSLEPGKSTIKDVIKALKGL